MATYLGEKFLQAQLDSLTLQTFKNWTLTISDDGSTDKTLMICENFCKAHPDQVSVLKGPQLGAAANFIHLLVHAPDAHEKDFYAFSDQDDVWLPTKLAKAVETLEQLSGIPQQALLYCGRTQIVNEDLYPLGLSPTPSRPLGLGNALIQNIVNGNTMVFNYPLLHLLRQVDPQHAVLHDWTGYLAVSGCDGKMYFDAEPHLLYRQHSSNVVGSQDRLINKFKRIKMLFEGRYRKWGDQTEAILNDLAPYLSDFSRIQVQEFIKMRNADSFFERIALALKGHFWRQTYAGQISFFIALIFKKI